MAKFLLFIGGLIIGQISYKVIHGYDCQYVADADFELLKKQSAEKDSLLYFWFNDYAFHIRLISGLETDSTIIKYQLWNHKCVRWRKKKQ